MNSQKHITASPQAISDFHRKLHRWYNKHGRKDLPWRNTDDPYPIYISEVMLQQTQVKTVLERYYYPFLERFPTLSDLAKAPQDNVLKRWEGLGYYNRAINLHKAAKQAAPHLPSTEAELLALPGIGKNTARALLAFGFHHPVAILEANVKRVMHRIFALETAKEDTLWQAAELLCDSKKPFDYNQAMMDIGATICTKKNPACGECPANHFCQGKTEPGRYPAPKAKKQTPTHKRNLVIWEDPSGRIYLSARDNRHLNGLYGLPQYEAGEKISLANQTAKHMQTLGKFRHVYSHYTLEATVLKAPYPTLSNSADWHEPKAIQKLALSRADQKAIALL